MLLYDRVYYPNNILSIVVLTQKRRCNPIPVKNKTDSVHRMEV